MSNWAQWFIDHNLRYALYVLYVSAIPFAIVWYIALETLPEIARLVTGDLKQMRNAKKGGKR